MKRKKRILWGRLLLWIGGALTSISLLYVYFFSGIFTITQYNLIGIEDANKESITSELENIASRKIFGIFPGNRTITPHRGEITDLIEETLPNTSSLKIYASSLHTLTIEVASYTPLFSVSDTHAITKEGVIYQEIHDITSLPRISIASSTSVSPDTLVALSQLLPQIGVVLYSVSGITIDEYSDIRLYDSTGQHVLIISGNTDVYKVWSTIVSALDTNPLKASLETKKGSLEYIDARFGNKVFYKFTDALAKGSIHSTSTPQLHESTTTATTTLQ